MDIAVFLLLFIVAAFAIYMLWLELPGATEQFQNVNFSASAQKSYDNGTQFYPNMRYPSGNISFSIASVCDSKKETDAITAFGILQDKTILTFYQVPSNGEIQILCSDIAPEPTDAGHFIAGEGGPRDILNFSGQLYVISSGRVSLYKTDNCKEPNIAIHEILHALGFDHNKNPNSIMFPITSCSETLDKYITDEINLLYKTPSLPDIQIVNASAVKNGRFLSFNVDVANYGLANADDVNLTLYNQNQRIADYDLNKVSMGIIKKISVDNLPIPRDTTEIKMIAYLTDGGQEISSSNNQVELSISS